MSEENTETQENATQSTEENTQTNTEPKSNETQADNTSTDHALKTPESYDLKLPKDSVLGEDAIERIASFAKEQGLSQEQAQSYLNRENEMLADLQNQQEAAIDKQANDWLEQAKSDPEIGGDNFNQNVEVAHRVIEKFGTDALKEGLNQTGLGNHPEFIRMLARVGSEFSEDQFVRGGRPVAQKPKSTADVLYGETS